MHTAFGFRLIASISLRTTRMDAVSASDWNVLASCKLSRPIKSCGVGQHFTVNGRAKDARAAEPRFIATQYSKRVLLRDASAADAVMLVAGSAELFMVTP